MNLDESTRAQEKKSTRVYKSIQEHTRAQVSVTHLQGVRFYPVKHEVVLLLLGRCRAQGHLGLGVDRPQLLHMLLKLGHVLVHPSQGQLEGGELPLQPIIIISWREVFLSFFLSSSLSVCLSVGMSVSDILFTFLTTFVLIIKL